MNSRKPDALKRAQGTFKPSRALKPAPPAGRFTEPPLPPKSLSRRARSEWTQLAPAAVGLGILRLADIKAFGLLCEMLATAAELQADLATEGHVLEGRANPKSRLLESARAQAFKALGEFGLSPRASLHVQTVAPPKRSRLDMTEDGLE